MGGAHHHVEVVSGSRPSVRPRGEPAAEQERHLRFAECSRDAFDALLDVSEGLFFRHDSLVTRAA